MPRSPIISGCFATRADAEGAARRLYARGFSVWDVAVLPPPRQPTRPSRGADSGGALLAACVSGGRGNTAAETLHEAGAAALMQSEGAWDQGNWTDYDPAGYTGRPLQVPEGEPWPLPPLAREAVATESTGNEDPGSELEHYVERQILNHS
jgi:hypothetical protein